MAASPDGTRSDPGDDAPPEDGGGGLPLLQGTLDVLVLTTLSRGPDHGYGVSRRIRERSDGDLVLDDGALYQALHRMRARGWIEGTWGVSDRGRRARFYGLTAEGRRRLAEERGRWNRYARAVGRVLEPS